MPSDNGRRQENGAFPIDADFETLDVALGFQSFNLFGLTNDGLTTWKRVGGQEGTQVVPHLATAIPQPTDGGRTYTFRIRKGIRYSTGEVVRAADFRRAFERLFALNEVDSAWYAAIPGAAACRKEPKACDLSRAIVTDNQAGTVTFRLTKPDPDFPAKLTFPLVSAVPSRTPLRDLGRRPLPATGPYMIASYAPGRQLRFVRNPHFREWSRSARPDGYVEEIVLKLGLSDRERIAAVVRGDADVADLTLSGASEIARLRSRFGSRLHSDPGPLVVFMFLNPRTPPFDDAQVRRALNLAVNREAVARTVGGSYTASPTCQVLPPNYAGYEPYCPYERDLDEARRLVASSRTRRQEIVVYARASDTRSFGHVVSALRGLGYRARLKTIAAGDYFTEIEKAGGSRIQAGFVGWIAAIPSPAEYFQSLLDYLGDVAGYSDKQVSAQVARALELQQTDLAAANEVWARVDRLLTDRDYLVPLYNPRANAFVSERVGNYQFHLFNYVLLDQLWVR